MTGIPSLSLSNLSRSHRHKYYTIRVCACVSLFFPYMEIVRNRVYSLMSFVKVQKKNRTTPCTFITNLYFVHTIRQQHGNHATLLFLPLITNLFRVTSTEIMHCCCVQRRRCEFVRRRSSG